MPGSGLTSANLAVCVLSSSSTLANDTSNTGDGVFGATDRSRNALVSDFVVTFTFQQGPQIANNPSPPDLSIVTGGARMAGISSGVITVNSTPAATLAGNLTALAPAVEDPSVLGTIGDVDFGNFLNPANGLANPPRRNNNAGVIAAGGDPAIPFPPGAAPENGLAGGAPLPPLGARLYVVDSTAGELKVFDSTTFLPLGRIPGIPSPGGIGIDPGNTTMYVSNFDSNTLQRIGIVPASSSTFHQVTATVAVGPNPTAVTVQPPE